MPTGIENRQAVFGWLNLFLRDQRNLQFTQSGFKNGNNMGNHGISDDTGYWSNPNYSRSKPPRFLFQIDATVQPPAARLPADLDEIGIGFSNTGDGSKTGLAVRILPIIDCGGGVFQRADEMEVNMLFIFHGPLTPGGAADPFSFNPATGVLSRTPRRQQTRAENYIFAALLGLRPRADAMVIDVGGVQQQISYGEVIDALAAAIHVDTVLDPLANAPVYQLSDDPEADRLTNPVDIRP